MKSFVSAPLIGPWLYRNSVKELKDRAVQGDVVAVQELAGIFCTSTDKAVLDITRAAFSSLVSQPAIDTLCKEALERDNPALQSIATDRNFLPTDSCTQALFLFVTGQWKRYTQCDPLLHRSMLAAGYTQTTNRGRFSARNAAKKTGQCAVLAAALMGTGHSPNTVPWSDEEWEIIIAGLIHEKDWEGLWRLVVHAPMNLAITALSAMEAAGWKPDGDERAMWEEITRNIPKEWTSPIPENSLPLTSYCPKCQPLRLAFSEDGTLLAAGCADGTVCLFTIRTGTLVFRHQTGQGTISGLAFSPDNLRMLCAGTSGTLQCYDTITATRFWSVTSGERTPVQFACSREGIVIVPMSSGGCIRIVNMADGQVQDLSGGHEAAVTCCALSYDGRLFSVGYNDGAVGIWDLQKTQYRMTLKGPGDPVRTLAFCDDEDILVIYFHNRPVRWHIRSGSQAKTYNGNTNPMRCCAITPDARSFAIAGEDRILRFWQAGKSDTVAEIPLSKRTLTTCEVSADGMKLVTGCNEGNLRIYTMNGDLVLQEYKAHKQTVTAIALSSPAEMIASAGWDGSVKLWNCTSGELVRTLMRPSGEVTGITSTPDGSTIYAGYNDGTIRQIEFTSKDYSKTLDMYTSTIRAIAINPDGTLLACAGGDNSLRIWNVKTGGLIKSIEGLTATQRCLVFSFDGKMLVSGGWDGKVRLWSVPDGNLLKMLAGHTSIITTIAISPDGTLLITGSNDRSVRLWTVCDGLCVSVLENSRSEVSALALSPDGTFAAFAGADAVIHLCHLPEGTPAPTIPSLPGKITALAFADNGRVLVAGLDTGTVAIFSCTGRNLMRTMTAHTAAVTGIVVLPKGTSVLTSSLDGGVRYWMLPWTKPLSGTTLDDISIVARCESTCSRTDALAQWKFLHSMLNARFSNDIELCTTFDDADLYDIQIVG